MYFRTNKKARKLGASIEIKTIEEAPKDWQGKAYFTGMGTCAKIPTAEEMLGWLEEQKCINFITISYANGSWYYDINTIDDCFWLTDLYFDSRKDATLAAIDDALDYFKKQKNL